MAAPKKIKTRNRDETPRVEQRSRKGRRPKRNAAMVFSRRNYILLIVGITLIVVGYVIMRLENEVDGFISLYVAPLLILGGYLEVMYAIYYREKRETAEETA